MKAGKSGDLRSKPLARSETGENKKTALSWSPDHERQLTFRSQKTGDTIITVVNQGRKIRRPAVKTARSVPYG